MENTILSPVMLWQDFDANEPLRESKTGEEVYGDVVYSDIYFSGRRTSSGNVRVYGVLARSKTAAKKSQKGAILILPDLCDTVNLEVINIYVNQGYTVLMVDYRGEWPGCENYTKYPDCISYANYKNVLDRVDSVPTNAKQTCWYEWVAVAKYAVSFLSSQLDIDTIGVLGLRNGANVGWILCGTDARVSCFVPLFGAGWRGYKGVYKNAEGDLIPDDEKLKFLAGIDAHAYAQYVKCPVLYMTATNSPDFDFDRATDTLYRISPETKCYANFTPTLRDVLNRESRRNIDLFFAKNLLNFKAVFPEEPVLTAMVEDGVVSCELELDYSDIKRPKNITVYIAEDGEDPSTREWKTATMLKGVREDKKSFTYTISGNCSFITMFAVVEYRSGVTLSSKVVSKKTVNQAARPQKLLYSTKDKLGTFTLYNMRDRALGGIFFEKTDGLNYVEGGSNISGIYSPYGLISYKLNNRTVSLNDGSILFLDVYCEEFTRLKLVLMSKKGSEESEDYVATVDIKGGSIWQKISVKANDFKSDLRVSIKDYSAVYALRLETETTCVFNNLLIV